MTWPPPRTTPLYISKWKRECLAWSRQEKSQITAWKTSGKFWSWTNAPHPGAVETHLLRYCLHPLSGQFQCKLFKKIICVAPQECPEIILPCDYILDRIKKLGLTLKWCYINKIVNLYMPYYVTSKHHKFQNKAIENPQDAPQHCARPTYGQ